MYIERKILRFIIAVLLYPRSNIVAVLYRIVGQDSGRLLRARVPGSRQVLNSKVNT